MSEVKKGEIVCIVCFLEPAFIAATSRRWFIQFHESIISNAVSRPAAVKCMSAPSLSHFKRAELGDEQYQRAGLGTAGVAFCQMIM